MTETPGGAPKPGLGAVGCLIILVLGVLATFLEHSGLRSFLCIGLVIAGVFAMTRWSKRQEQERIRAAKREQLDPDPHVAQATGAGHPPLGETYAMKVRLLSADGKHTEAPSVYRRVEVTPSELRLRSVVSQPDPPGARAGIPDAIAISDLGSIRVEPNAFLVAWLSAYGESKLVLQPRSYNDRERLTWELAVRAPDAMERGLDAGA